MDNNNMDREETREKIMNWSKKVSESFILSARAYYLYHNMEKEQEIERTIEDLYNNPHSKCYLYNVTREFLSILISQIGLDLDIGINILIVLKSNLNKNKSRIKKKQRFLKLFF